MGYVLYAFSKENDKSDENLYYISNGEVDIFSDRQGVKKGHTSLMVLKV